MDADVWAFPFDEGGLELNASYSQARSTEGLGRVRQAYGEAAWPATRYEDVRLVLADPRFSRAMSMTENCPRTTEGVPGCLLFMDRQDHARIRGLVAKAFTMRQVAALRPKVHQLTATLAERIASTTPPVDLVEDYAKPARSTVIFELLDIPPEDRNGFRSLCEGVLSSGAMSAEEFGANHVKLNGYMAELVHRRRREPGDDLMTALIAARDLQDRLSEDVHRHPAACLPEPGAEFRHRADAATRRVGEAGGRTASASECHRGAGAVRAARRGRAVPPIRHRGSRAAASWSEPENLFSCRWPRPTVTRPCSLTRTGSSWAGRTTATWVSGTAFISASTPGWPAWCCTRNWPP
ncbi:hypothetical protein [Amycolatopsis sp. NPDC049868]|uniref:hypothetical protein n=1 Tax=Amycolatopsis sp. NPDC049868 TaxID=3363934 RepID=UPI00379FB3FD